MSDTGTKSKLEQAKNHWIIWLPAMLFGASLAGFGVSEWLRVQPKQEEISHLEQTIPALESDTAALRRAIRTLRESAEVLQRAAEARTVRQPTGSTAKELSNAGLEALVDEYRVTHSGYFRQARANCDPDVQRAAEQARATLELIKNRARHLGRNDLLEYVEQQYRSTGMRVAMDCDRQVPE